MGAPSAVPIDMDGLLDGWPECARILTTDGVLMHINAAGETLVGVTADMVRGRHWPQFWPPESRGLVEAAIAGAAAGTAQTFRGMCKSLGGRRMWLDTVVSPVRNVDGEITRLLAVSRDVTASVESEMFLETLIRLLPNPILAKNARDGRYVLINQAAESAFGLSSAEMVGRVAAEIFPQDEADGFAKEDALVISTRSTRVSAEEPITTREGVRYFTTKKFATYDGDQALHVVILGEDVTEQRGAANTLRQAVADAENANRAKSEFLANMSHEIRTPLNGIVAGADMLARSDLDDRARELVGIIAASGATLERLLSDILDVARIEAGRIEIETTAFHLGDLVRATASLAKLQADEKGVAVEVSVAKAADRLFQGDPYRIRQVLLNLLSNAVKFTERGAVTVSAAVRKGGMVRLTVRDTGIGFDPGMKEQLFGRFNQADGSITRRFGGTGLGMTISRELASLMGGSLDAKGRAGEGATFWLDVPLTRAEGVEAEAAACAEPLERGLRVLVADDHPTNRKVVELMLEDLAEVVSVENGEAALAALHAAPFDMVLMDMQMPVMDGLEATRRIRETEVAAGRAGIPLIMLSANALPEHVAASQAAGADRHLEKPVTLAALLDAMNQVLSAEEPALIST